MPHLSQSGFRIDLPSLATTLTAKFGKGFDVSNLRHMRGLTWHFQFTTHCVVN